MMTVFLHFPYSDYGKTGYQNNVGDGQWEVPEQLTWRDLILDRFLI